MYIRTTILIIYKQQVENAKSLSAPVRLVLEQLMELYVIYWALQKLGDLLLVCN